MNSNSPKKRRKPANRKRSPGERTMTLSVSKKHEFMRQLLYDYAAFNNCSVSEFVFRLLNAYHQDALR